MEEALWESANKLRGSVEPSEYKHVVLSLIFLKYANDRFEERRNELLAEGKEAFADQAVFYNAKNVFYLDTESRWSFIMENAKQNDIAIKIDKALADVEKANPTLRGALPSNYYSGLGLDKTKLSALLDEINKIDTLKDRENDLIGRVYEYFLGKFAIAEGKGKGEYYSTDISVTLWVLNKNKKARTVEQNGELVQYRNREDEVLFMDLRQIGEPFEKKYIQFSKENIEQIAATYHAWQYGAGYQNVPEYCYSATLEEIESKNWSLVPSKYIEFVNRDDYAGYEETMSRLQTELRELFAQEEESKKAVEKVFEELGYELQK